MGLYTRFIPPLTESALGSSVFSVLCACCNVVSYWKTCFLWTVLAVCGWILFCAIPGSVAYGAIHSLRTRALLTVTHSEPTITKAVVMTVMKGYDVTPFVMYLPRDVRFFYYGRDLPWSKQNLEPNVGFEAAVYLHFIVEHYDSLPDRTVFIHGHRNSWHTFAKDTVLMLAHFLWDKAPPFVSLNPDFYSQWLPSSPERAHLSAVWTTLFAKDLAMTEPPRFIKACCCAQFAVTADRIKLRPRAFYQHLYNWTVSANITSYWSSRIFEQTWHMIFGENPEAPKFQLHEFLNVSQLNVWREQNFTVQTASLA